MITPGHRSGHYLIGHIHFLSVIWSSMISSLHRFQDITTFTVYVTACDLEKSFEFQQDTRNYRSHALSDSRVNTSQLIRTIFPKVWGLEKFQTAKVTFKVTQGHCCRRHSIGHMIFYYSSIVAISLSCTNSEILSLISPKLSRSHDLNTFASGADISCMLLFLTTQYQSAHKSWSAQLHPFQWYDAGPKI